MLIGFFPFQLAFYRITSMTSLHTNIPIDQRTPEALATGVRFAIRQALKRIHTSMPGVVVSYDAATRRAVVQPALRRILTTGEVRQRAQLVNVPVLVQGGGGYMLHVPLAAGDAVMLGFTQRGMSAFKKTLAESDPDAEAILSPAGAYVIASFGNLDAAPATDGLVLQTNDGGTYISLRGGEVKIEATRVRRQRHRLRVQRQRRPHRVLTSAHSPSRASQSASARAVGSRCLHVLHHGQRPELGVRPRVRAPSKPSPWASASPSHARFASCSGRDDMGKSTRARW